MRLIGSFITQLKDQGPSRTCDESKEEEEGLHRMGRGLHRIEYTISKHITVHSCVSTTNTCAGYNKTPAVCTESI